MAMNFFYWLELESQSSGSFGTQDVQCFGLQTCSPSDPYSIPDYYQSEEQG
jgi:hypothetical protein